VLLDTVCRTQNVKNLTLIGSLVVLKDITLSFHIKDFFALEVKRLLTLVKCGLKHNFLFKTFASFPLCFVN